MEITKYELSHYQMSPVSDREEEVIEGGNPLFYFVLGWIAMKHGFF